MNHTSVNRVILNSIPLNRKMKGYWISKYERISCNCGADEAVRKFKNLRIQLLSYLADPNRRTNLATYLSSTGFRKNGYLRMLFEYCETQPHFVLSFIKMYSAEQHSTDTVDAAARATHERLSKVKSNDSIPRYLEAWLDLLSGRYRTMYSRIRKDVSHPLHRLALNLSPRRWQAYWTEWRRVCHSGWKSSRVLDYKPIFPEVYKDYQVEHLESDSYEQDFADLISLHMEEDEPALSQEALDFIDGYLDEEVGDALSAVLFGEFPENLADVFSKTSVLSGLYVGHIHHIHKKGGGTELRDIAVPNRFIQNALVPCADRLYNLVRAFPQDSTFDQARFDAKIQNRVQNDTLYQGSVDLSKATDNLPLSWGVHIVEHLQKMFGLSAPRIIKEVDIWEYSHESGPDVRTKRILDSDGWEKELEFLSSWELFKAVSRAKWEDEGYLTSWTVGQPLGSFPSFAMLSITHNMFIESLAASLGLSHHPYAILGDDIVIFNKKLRRRYVRELTSRAIPLSLHKSFEGRLTEFAGKTYVKGCVPFYCSDHSPITWESLFDYQRVTGIRIPWNCLPRTIRNKIIYLANGYYESRVPRKSVVKLAREAYELVLTCEITGRGSHIYQFTDSGSQSERMVSYFANRVKNDEPSPEGIPHSGITLLAGRPVTLLGSQFADHDGWFHRFRPVELPQWYRDKVRPVATTAAISASLDACSESR